MMALITGPGIISALGERFSFIWFEFELDIRLDTSPEGEDHHRHRKIMHPAFGAPQLRAFLPLFQRIAGKVRRVMLLKVAWPNVHWQLSEKWKAELVGTSELDVAVNKLLSRATLDIIGEGSFSAFAPAAFAVSSPTPQPRLTMITTL